MGGPFCFPGVSQILKDSSRSLEKGVEGLDFRTGERENLSIRGGAKESYIGPEWMGRSSRKESVLPGEVAAERVKERPCDERPT